MENIINNPGLQHIAENIFCNLSDKDIKLCQEINQFCKQILKSPLFWKEKFMRQLSKKNQNDWNEAIQMTKAPSQAGCLRVTMRTAAAVAVIQAGQA